MGQVEDKPLKAPSRLGEAERQDPQFAEWLALNVHAQRQEGYSMVDVHLPLGDITSLQARKLADVARKYVKDTLRTTVDQNLLLQWVSNADLPGLFADLPGSAWPKPGPGGSRTSSLARGPIPASSASPLRGDWPPTCASSSPTA